jgi:hypothetical protein
VGSDLETASKSGCVSNTRHEFKKLHCSQDNAAPSVIPFEMEMTLKNNVLRTKYLTNILFTPNDSDLPMQWYPYESSAAAAKSGLCRFKDAKNSIALLSEDVYSGKSGTMTIYKKPDSGNPVKFTCLVKD